jgi:predicted PurR-regulated permease PerM
MMTTMPTHRSRFRKAFLLVLIAAVSVAFIWMVQGFLLTILMAAIFSGLLYPVYARLVRVFGGRTSLASAVALVGAVLLVVLPMVAILGVVLNQAVRVTQNVRPFVERAVSEPTFLDQQLQRLPGYARIEPYRDEIVTRAGDAVSAVGSFLIGSLSETTRMTVTFVFQFFILLYTVFFFLIDGPRILSHLFTFLPLRDTDEQAMKDRFVSITRATIKGTIVIGVIQGTLNGLAFWLVGIPDALFWTVVMAVLAILPLVGAALVWVPACLILAAQGQVWQAVTLAVFASLIVGSVDNVLRPRLVGRDTKMHDLLILFSTLSGIAAFGPLGFIVGPILAGLFLTSWEIFRESYQDELEAETVVPMPAGANAAADAEIDAMPTSNASSPSAEVP